MAKQYLTPEQMNTLDCLGFKAKSSAYFDETVYGDIDPVAHFAYPGVDHKHPCYMAVDLIEATRDWFYTGMYRHRIIIDVDVCVSSVLFMTSDTPGSMVFNRNGELIDNLFDAIVYCYTKTI